MMEIAGAGEFEQWFAIEGGKHSCLLCDRTLVQSECEEGLLVVDCGNCGNQHHLHYVCKVFAEHSDKNGLPSEMIPAEVYNEFFLKRLAVAEAENRAAVAAQN